jgi:ketosteroid isomerase-like protein
MSKAFVITLFVLVLFPVLIALGETPADTQLISLEQTWMTAAQHRDIRVLDNILSDDYIDINYKGMLRDKADALRAANLKLSQYTQKLSQQKVRFYGNTAIVTGHGELLGSDHSSYAAWRFTDVFVKQDGVWRAVSSQETVEQSH